MDCSIYQVAGTVVGEELFIPHKPKYDAWYWEVGLVRLNKTLIELINET